MEIYLVRHTRVDVAKGICYGKSDVGLATSFEQDIQQVKQKISSELSHYLVHSSPLQRCKLLAEALNESDESILFDARWQEMDFGDWELKLWNDIPTDESHEWMQDFVNMPAPNGESFIRMAARVQSVWEDLLRQDSEKQVVVCHGGVVRLILCLVLDLDLKNAFKIEIDYGSITKISYSPHWTKVQYVNR
ncbi:alpha-ribazole phosphatase [Flectobacillus major]|uniref:alpha-ribazole phosphatase n=1 Tax=Flectobacillus major TaxID=103 RepID=UPI00040678AA|nr:alpha-ribazole phosphatase [Flectobacillus major]